MGKKAFSAAFAEQHGLPGDKFPDTEEEVLIAQTALDLDFEKLSLDDREKLVFDIHGLPSIAQASDLKERQQKLDALDAALENISNDEPRKSAYDSAVSLNPEYVKKLRTLFLLANEWDPKLAADQMIQHFVNKEKLFGSGEVLGRDILMSDLSKEDMEHLNNGCTQVLPSRDTAGRVVIFCAPGYGGYSKVTNSICRALWYFFQAVMAEEGAAELGLVIVDYGLGKYGNILDLDVIKELANTFVDGACQRTVVEHYCYDHDDPAMHYWAHGASVFSDDSYRHRLRLHFGSQSDVLFKLQTYGIPTHELPINNEQTLDYTWHRQWIEIQRKKETAMNPKILCVIPRRFDVLFGRGRDTRVHAGNIRAKHLVEMRFDEYEKSNKKEKTNIAKEIVAQIKASNGRFLICHEGNVWR
ncbi:Transfer protein [Seminavis robusta]|uniref:Transfer protein n=1 Tax=Seminavis robusta TaxID=568900 RepID=A0A9N8F4B8_9STRA|nr:Transfer protein [Seminavis robusta]|eukprot:Sro2853_g338670.1 Transfer protein (414) ;mRNA; f:6149-7528